MSLRPGILGFLMLFAAGPALAEASPEPATVALTLKDHRFTPQRVTVPAGRKIRIELTNRDAASEEFDSVDLHVEKDVTPNGRASFTVGPLQPGTYAFMGELHADTASGELIATAQP
jgi:plastocyanin